MKTLIKRLLRRHGLHVYTDASLPTGVDWLHDIRRAQAVGVQPVCLDVGANVGQTVLELLQAFPLAHVHAFEPFARTHRHLVEAVGHLPRVHAVASAMGARRGSLQVRPHPVSVLSSLVARDPVGDPADLETIEVDTVDSYVERKGLGVVDILKTDTEGYDLEVLEGAQILLDAHHIGFVLSEVTLDDGNRHNTSFDRVFERLTGHGYVFVGLYETYPLHHFARPNLYCNALFASPGRRAVAGAPR